ncbi:MAG: sterol desaturase family protein [Flavobacteriales bacterium]|nr:sterol desaturase family protein [Flavobacteriales bacterium]
MTEVNLIHLAIPGFVILMIVEIILTRKMHEDNYEVKDSAASISMGLGNVAVGLISKGLILAAFMLMYRFRLWEIPVTWWSWILLFFVEDLSYYWMHRVSHRNRFFWASHVVHHSSQRYNLSTALRQTWTGSFFTFIFWLWLPLLGFHPLMVMTQMAISLLYQFWIHTQTIDRMPRWFEMVFNTPSHHRVHHATNPRYLDRNHAGILIIWDKLFGTFEAEDAAEPPVYGLTRNIATYNPVSIAFHEWIDMFRDFFGKGLKWRDRLGYLWHPPGWRHDGSGKLAEDIREEWENGANPTILTSEDV